MTQLIDPFKRQIEYLGLIEVMPMGETGRNSHYLDLQTIKQQLQEKHNLVDGVVAGAGPARYLQMLFGSDFV